MSSFNLKLIAVLAMLVDHIGFVFFPEVLEFRIIGRIAFPLFAFLIAEGFIKTSNVGNYLLRLSTFAVISQAPFYMVMIMSDAEVIKLNIFFTLSLGLGVLIAFKKIKSVFVSVPVIAFFLFLAESINFEYGAYGILLILASYIFLLKRKIGILSWVATNLIAMILFLDLQTIIVQVFSFATLPFMVAYNGKRGKIVNKWWFYCFYPVHLFILGLIKFFLIFYS